MPDLSAATQKAQQALDSPIDLALDAPTLEVALGRIAAATGTSIRIDLPTFMSRQINLSQPAPPRLKGESLRTAFEQLWATAKGQPVSAVPVSAHEGAIHIDPFRWPPYPRGGAFQQGRFVVNGRVVDEAGRPVPNATVRLYCWAWVVLAATNDEGRFFATLPTNGNLSIEAWDAAGTSRGWIHTDRMGGGVRVTPFEPTLKLKPVKQVTVHVTDGDQKPVQDASVVLIGAGYPYDAPLTSQAGETTLQIPADLEADSIIAWKNGAGMDYTATRDSGTSAGPGGPPLDTSKPTTLQLSRGSTLRVRVVDEADKPIAGQPLAPWVIKKHGAAHSFNTTHFHGRSTRLTDQNGEITFDWPAWQAEKVSFSGSNPRYSRVSLSLEPSDAKSAPQTIRLDRNVAVRGRVLGPDGKPVPDVYVVARGPASKPGSSGYLGNGSADVAGRFEFFLPPQRPYLFVAISRDGKQISPPEERVLDDPTRDIDDVVLYLRPAIRVFGRVAPRDTTREDTRPSLRLISDDFSTRQDVKLPMSDSLTPIRAVEEIQVDIEPDGTFSVLAGPGRYEFVPVKGAPGIPIELTEQTEYEVEVPPM